MSKIEVSGSLDLGEFYFFEGNGKLWIGIQSGPRDGERASLSDEDLKKLHSLVENFYNEIF